MSFVFYKDSAGRLWLGTYGGGLNRFDETKNEFVIYKNDPNDSYSISDDFIISIEEDKAGRLLVGTYNGGLNFLIPHQRSFTSICTTLKSRKHWG